MRKGAIAGYVLASEAAKTLGMTVQAIGDKCRKNRIKGAFQLSRGGQWHIPISYIERKKQLMRAIYEARTAKEANHE